MGKAISQALPIVISWVMHLMSLLARLLMGYHKEKTMRCGHFEKQKNALKEWVEVKLCVVM